MIKKIIDKIKKNGLKIILVAALWEGFEHFCLPAILFWSGVGIHWAVLSGCLPIGELIFYPTIYFIVGKN